MTLHTNPASAQPAGQPPTRALTYDEARQIFLAESDALAASRAAVESARLQRQGARNIGGPNISVGANTTKYGLNTEIQTGPLRQEILNQSANLPFPPGSQLPFIINNAVNHIPNSVNLHRSGHYSSGNITGVWPVYTGGLTSAILRGLDAKTDEASADDRGERDMLETGLVDSYFNAQLAIRVAQLHDQAVAATREHEYRAERMLKAGLLARVDVLEAQAALADAIREADKAHNNVQLAVAVLGRALHSPVPVDPISPLFVNSKPLLPLSHFIDIALHNHPELDVITAKRGQAEAVYDAEKAMRRPRVIAYARREVPTSGKGSWFAGVGLNWTLWDNIDRSTMARAAMEKVNQADHSYLQAKRDIATLVEKNWLDVEHAREQYLLQKNNEELAEEVLRLREAGLQAGTSTVVDLNDAQVNLTKALTERALSAAQYVKALAALLQSTGQPEDFELYQASADIRIPVPAQRK